MNTARAMQGAVQSFLRMEAAGGLLLVIAAVVATLIMNSPWATHYTAVLHLPVIVQVGSFGVDKPLLLWINDGLMAVFFFLVGLELKREFLEGELSSMSQVALPSMAALGGVAVPAAIYLAFNHADPTARNGWAIPTATDIAFAVAVVGLLGPKIPGPLKIFLLTLAIADDLGAILIIAVFYSGPPSVAALIAAAVAVLALLALNRWGVDRGVPYLVVGAALWLAVLKSGVHATLAGVLCAAFVPLTPRVADTPSPLRTMERELHPWVACGILPFFALANAGISFEGLSGRSLLEPVALGIALALLIGKPVGVMAAVALTVVLRLGRLPEGSTWLQVLGVSLVCGIGFTMSLFIGSLAFENDEARFGAPVRLGVFTGSILAALLGWLVLRLAPSRPARPSFG